MPKKKDITSMRGALEQFKADGDVLIIKEEIDPILEVAAFSKAMDSGPVLLFENIKGYPNARDITNVYANEQIYPRLFGATTKKELMRKAHNALLNPIPPNVVKEAPVQEVCYTKNIDIFKIIPILKHTEVDAGRILGGLNCLISGKYFHGGFEISFKRTHFLEKDRGTIMAGDHTHIGKIIREFKGQRIPVTLN